MDLYYSPLDPECKSVIGALTVSSKLILNIYKKNSGEENVSAALCSLLLFEDGKQIEEFPMKETSYGYTLSLKINQVGLYFYCFRLGMEYLSCGQMRTGILLKQPRFWQLTVCEQGFQTPDWFKGGIMYQIFPDRFFKSGHIDVADHKILRSDWGGQPNFRPNEFGKVLNNDFFGGNFKGICEKLDYIKQFGVNTIYFNPIFEAYSNHRYDTGDYMKIDPLLGTVEDFDKLIEEGKNRGIRIVLDGVFNHTGDDSRYFNKYGRYDNSGAYQSKDSPYSDWFHFRSFPDSYDSWWGIETLPAVNERSESYQNFVFGENGVLKTWLRHGIGGYRLDVADELPDFFLQKLRTAVKDENKDALIIGEVWEDASNKIAYSERRRYLQGNQLDSVMNYPLKDAIINFVLTGRTAQLRETIAMLIDNYPKIVLDSLMNILGTHDTPRILTVLSKRYCTNKEEMARLVLSREEREIAKQRLKYAVLLQYTLPGVPCIYYGDEIGMEGYSDPFCRGCFTWNFIDEDLSAYYRKLGEIREKQLKSIFTEGVYREIFADDACLIFERKSDAGVVYVYVNPSSNLYNIEFEGKFRECLTDEIVENKFICKAYSCGILVRAS